MTSGGSGWVDKLVGACFGLLLAAFAVYCAIKLIEAIWPVLVVVVGVVAILGLVVGGIVVFRTWRERW